MSKTYNILKLVASEKNKNWEILREMKNDSDFDSDFLFSELSLDGDC